jgi:FimV-like protein
MNPGQNSSTVNFSGLLADLTALLYFPATVLRFRMQTIHYYLTYFMAHASLRHLLIATVLALLAIFIFLYAQQKKSAAQTVDFTAIAGDDVNATQLDLAKAYLEMGQKHLAKNILRQTVKQGSKPHKTVARQLLKSL